MSLLSKLLILPKAWRQLGSETIWLFLRYQLLLRSGWLRLQTLPRKRKSFGLEPRVLLRPAEAKEIEKLLGGLKDEIITQADEILGGNVRLFGMEPRKLNLSNAFLLQHWTKYHSQLPNGEDIKPAWEIGRFSWATVLARAYWLSSDERYAKGFWKFFEEFNAANPRNLGPHWSSAQEVALRLISWAFCYSLIEAASATTQDRKVALADIAAAHAERIVPTLDYARAQSNNHLLSEALGLGTAAALIREHPNAAKWRETFVALFNEGIVKQVHKDGAYVQHSTNYHRLLLQLGCWAEVVFAATGEKMPESWRTKLSSATEWLFTLLDESGRVPNLGPNDGAYVLPLSALPFGDFRPVLQASSLALGNQAVLEPGVWDEMALWLGFKPTGGSKLAEGKRTPIRLEGKNGWAYLRAEEFKERPGHADQLHVDIWWRGHNIAQDAGSYLYTAAKPWDNALAGAKVHNTVTINEQEPMTRARRFLWLDWANAKDVDIKEKNTRLISAEAEHDGYQRLNVKHRRTVAASPQGWTITDRLLPFEEKKKPVRARLHWLLPDWDWQIDTQELRIESPYGEIEIAIDVSVGDLAELKVVRAGEVVHGSGEESPILGWTSPTYGVKKPALSFIADAVGPLPITIISTWTLPRK